MEEKVQLPVTTYEPNYIIKAGIKIWPEMVRELIQYRGLIWRFIVRNISARYKQSVLGLFWSFLTPLVMTLVFVWVKNKNFLPIADTDMSYILFVFLGQMIWLLFAGGVSKTAHSLVSAGSMLGKINFPKEVLVISATGEVIFDFLLRIPLLIFILIWTGTMPGLSILLLPFALLPLILLTLGIGYIVALFNAILRDTGNIITLILSLGMFATPVIYPPPESWPMSFLVNYLNPISSFVTASRDLVFSTQLSDPAALVFSSMLAVLLFLFSWRVFHILEPKIAERI